MLISTVGTFRQYRYAWSVELHTDREIWLSVRGQQAAVMRLGVSVVLGPITMVPDWTHLEDCKDLLREHAIAVLEAEAQQGRGPWALGARP